MSDVDQHAKLIWDYMLVHDELKPADMIICLGSHDLNVARRAAELYNKKLASKILITGGRGKITANNDQTEANAFAAIMYAAGVPENAVMIEDQSTNTGENARFSKDFVKDIYSDIATAILVTKPYMQRRAKATFAQFWPELQTMVTSQQVSYEEYMKTSILGRDKSINVMVGDLQRIMEYPVKGWMVSQVVPKEVKTAYYYLMDKGYKDHVA